MIKAIIFDFDGVIVESMDIKARAFAFLFKDYPEYVDQIVKFHLLHGGMSRFEKFRKIYRDMLNKELSKEKEIELGDQFSQFVYQEVIKCPFVNGALEVLEKYHKKITFFVVSGTPQEEIRSIVKERSLEEYFVEVFGSPEKKGVLNSNIIEKYKLAPEEVIFIGDSIDDWEGVKDKGIRFIGRITKENPFEGLGVETLVEDLFGIMRILDDECV